MLWCSAVRLALDTPALDRVARLRARIAELEDANARLRQAARHRDELPVARLAARDAQVEELRRRLEGLRSAV